MELSIIFVNWNSVDYLRECIGSIYENTRSVEFEIIVVDNASPQGGIETIGIHFPEVTIIKCADNLGFAGANNVGFKTSTGEYVLFLNPDTKLIGPSINIMLDHIKRVSDAGIVGCKLLNTDLSVQLSSIQTFPTILNQALDAEYLRLRWPQCRLWKIAPLLSENVDTITVDVIPGACMLIRRNVFEKVDLFSEDYFMYAEDLDLNYKVKAAGFTNYYLGKTAIIHHGGKSSSSQPVSHWATIMKYRAMLRLFQKRRGPLYALGYRVAMGGVAAGRLAVLAFVSLFGNSVWDTKARRFASEKWRSVLKWAVGRQEAVQAHR